MTHDRSPETGVDSWASDLLRAALGTEIGAGVMRCLEFAIKAHYGQTRLALPGTQKVPYVAHPVKVAALCAKWLGPSGLPVTLHEALLCAALLHDTVEDCAVPIDDLEQRFGSEVASLVLALTKPELKRRESSDERMRRFSSQIATAGPAAVFLKSCDLIDNLSELETTPRDVLRRAVARGRAHYLPLLDANGLSEEFRAAVEEALSSAEAALAAPTSSVVKAERDSSCRLHRTIAEAARGKTGLHDAGRFLADICGFGDAVVVRFAPDGSPTVVAGPSTGIDPGRLNHIRKAAHAAGGTTRLRRHLLRTNSPDASSGLGAVFAAVDRGFDGSDTLVIWKLPEGYEGALPAGFSASAVLMMVLALVTKPASELHRDVAKEALKLGIELDLGLVADLGIRRGHLRKLAAWRQLCDLASEQVEAEIRAFVHSQRSSGPLWHRVRIERRLKSFPSILGKFATSYPSLWPDFSVLEDIGGVRVICPTAWHVDASVGFFEGSTSSRPLACPLRRYDLEPTPAGYRGVHAIRIVRVPGADTDVRCEVQIRTLLQDAWSTLSHTIAYKQRKEDMHHRRDALRDLSKRLDDCEKVAMALFARAVGSEHARTTSPGEKTAVDA